MKKLTFSIQINAPAKRVWEILWGAETYPRWTSAFAEGSRAETDWQEGSKVLFGDGQGSGMVSRIARSIPHEFMSFEHLGEIKDGVEDLTSAWAGALENYTLRENGGSTALSVELDIEDSFGDMFTEAFPKALQIVKELAEA